MPTLPRDCWPLWHHTLSERILSDGSLDIACSHGIGDLALLEPSLVLRLIGRTAVAERRISVLRLRILGMEMWDAARKEAPAGHQSPTATRALVKPVVRRVRTKAAALQGTPATMLDAFGRVHRLLPQFCQLRL